MKKLLFLVPLAAVALASCSNDEQISRATVSDTQELTIRPIVGNTTRAVITDANFNQFHVKATVTDGAFWRVASTATEAPTAEPTEDGAVQTTLSLDVLKNGGKWDLFGTNETNYKWYWSSKNANGTFVGYNQGEESVEVGNAIADQTDILVAYNTGAASTFTNGVPMLFRHVLSQIVIKADNKDADIRQIKVGGVRLHNIKSRASLTHPAVKTTSGDFDWTTTDYTPWSSLSLPTKYRYFKGTAPTDNNDYSGDAITLNATAQDITFDGPVLLIPQKNETPADLTSASTTGVYFDVLIQVRDLEKTASDAKYYIYPAKPEDASETWSQTYAWVAVPVAIDWKPGFKYTYVLHFSKDGIGKQSPDKEDGGNDDPDPGHNPGTDIVDNPVPLYFTVTIDEWQDASTSPEEKDL